MSSSSSSPLSVLGGWLLLVLLVIDLGCTSHRYGAAAALTVKQLPHLQTFDSWDTCVYDGISLKKPSL